MELRRWTPLTFLAPGRYVDRDPWWAGFDLEAWADGTYDWVEDDWNGFADFARRPRETVAAGTGDCEDFALVAVAWAVATDREGVGLGFCWEFPTPWPTHVIAYDDERVYSSGHLVAGSVEDWLAGSRYDRVLRRRVR